MRKPLYALLLWSAALLPAEAVDNVHFTGTLTSGSCDLVLQGDLLDEVVFPTMSTSGLMARGQSAKVPVTFELENCDVSRKGRVSIKLTGAEDGDLPGYLAIDGGSVASGIGIGIETLDGAAVAINGNSGTTFTLEAGHNTLHLNAWIQAKTGVTPVAGDFTATATATFEYL
ncbi:fimbrial protein [Pseudocitrobacter cyperus]|uniref:Fimbrial protein n=1 Tax=Pseudocitrobacter cyperus TaxID=3112843 RepID=A0ABV0HK62_9ENTR